MIKMRAQEAGGRPSRRRLRLQRTATPFLLLLATLSFAGCAPPPSCPEQPSSVGAVGSAGYALRFCGTGANDLDRVKVRIDDPDTSSPGPMVDVGATDFTIEFWMKALAHENRAGRVTCGPNKVWIDGNIIMDRDRYNQDREYGISMAGGRIVFGVRGTADDPLTICGSTRVDDGEWHHVAVTRASATGALQLFIDGNLDASASSGPPGDISYPDHGVPGNFCGGPCDNSDPFLVFGAEKHDAGPDWPAFSGWLDEVRISEVIRYAGPFERPEERFQPDSATVALWHFDEGRGDTVADASRGGSAGVIHRGGPYDAPRWTISSAPLR